MKRRFFFIIFSFLAVTIIVVSAVQQFYVHSERNRLIDQRLETIASSLIASGLSFNLIQNLESTDDLIHDLIGDERVDMLINIYTLDGSLLAQNYTASVIALKFSSKERWQAYDVDGRNIRVLNLPHQRLIIQVGIIVDPAFNRPFFNWNLRFFAFVTFVSLLLIIAAYSSAGILFSPLRHLTSELESLSGQLNLKLGQSLSEFVIGPELRRLSKKTGSQDEFERLCSQIESFIHSLESYARSFNAQMAILTHELKTPLTILKNRIEEIHRSNDLQITNRLSANALTEIDRLAELINRYLQWSVLTSNPGQPNDLYANKLDELTASVIAELNTIHKNRLILSSEGHSTVIASPDHLRQVIVNLLTNALKYSPVSARVECHVGSELLVVKDYGSGIPKSVLDYLGQPFNRGPKQPSETRGSGLGLAWVFSICNRYGWKLDIQSSSTGTEVHINFNPQHS